MVGTGKTLVLIESVVQVQAPIAHICWGPKSIDTFALMCQLGRPSLLTVTLHE